MISTLVLRIILAVMTIACARGCLPGGLESSTEGSNFCLGGANLTDYNTTLLYVDGGANLTDYNTPLLYVDGSVNNSDIYYFAESKDIGFEMCICEPFGTYRSFNISAEDTVPGTREKLLQYSCTEGYCMCLDKICEDVSAEVAGDRPMVLWADCSDMEDCGLYVDAIFNVTSSVEGLLGLNFSSGTMAVNKIGCGTCPPMLGPGEDDVCEENFQDTLMTLLTNK
uniref:Lipoprotein n=1 Tax=Steinernema glaseri TaxID=37863 RepID=A0A1I7Y0C9_9BILA